jgi:hypothetical protein
MEYSRDFSMRLVSFAEIVDIFSSKKTFFYLIKWLYDVLTLKGFGLKAL